MKPRNEQERAVVALHATLPALSMKQLNWILGQDTERGAQQYAKTGKKVSSWDYYCVVTTCQGWQVTRYYLIHSSTGRNGYAFESLTEISQRWMRMQDGQTELHVFELPKSMCWQWKAQPYCLTQPLSLKPWSTDYNRSGRTYMNMADCEIVPGRRFAPCFKEAGLAKAAGRVDEIALYKNKSLADEIKSLPLSQKEVMPLRRACYLPAKCESLFKMGETSLALEFLSRSVYAGYISRYWKSFLVARRHGLKNIDWRLWLDYVHDLEELGRDIHSPKYLVPADLGQAHGSIVAKLQALRDKARREAERATIRDNEAVYKKMHGAYLGLAIVTPSGLTITPLQSVSAVYDEGEAMHHCIYTCGYWKRPDTLLLSAKDKDGKRVESIEVNLNELKVMQSRGVCNRETAFHKEIMKAMKDNMWRIDEIASQSRRVAC